MRQIEAEEELIRTDHKVYGSSHKFSDAFQDVPDQGHYAVHERINHVEE